MAQKTAFKSGELVVYPAHGVGVVEGIETMEVANENVSLYTINFEQEHMRLKVPVNRAKTSGLRKLSSADQLDKAFETLKGRARIRRTMWSRRAQEYENKINSGSPVLVAEVLRDLRRNSESNEQSYSERQIYQLALGRLSLEVAAVKEIDEKAASHEIEAVLIATNPKEDEDL